MARLKDYLFSTGNLSFMVALIGLAIVAGIQAFVMSKYYLWFLLPVVGVPVPYGSFLGFALILHYLRIEYNNRVKKVEEFGLKELIQAFLLPVVFLAIGYTLFVLS